MPVTCADCTDPRQPPKLTDPRKQIADPASVYQLIAMMQGVVRRGTGFAAGKGLNRAIAGKTGTSQEFNDAWFSGFTPDLATTVWIGFDNPVSLGNNQTGGGLAAPIWHDFMAIALKDRPVLAFPVPPGLTLVSSDNGVVDAFKPGQVPGASNATMTGSVDPIPTGGDSAATGSAEAPVHGGVDKALGGLY